jgi:hypothetical protein
LQNNGSDDYATTSNGPFKFPTLLADGAMYDVKVLTQPAGQTCTVAGATGSISGSSVTSVSVTCATSDYSIGGTLSGLVTGNTVTLQDNGGDNLTLNANGAFTFPTKIANGGAYDVAVLTQPTSPPQVCTVSAGSGHASGNVTAITVNCATDEFTIGGTVTGLQSGQTITLRDNGGDDLLVSSNGAFAFATPLPGGSTYDVSFYSTNTLGVECTPTNATGTVSAATGPITNVTLTCVTTIYWVYGTVAFFEPTSFPGAEVTISMSGSPASYPKTLAANQGTSFAFPVEVGTNYTLYVSEQPNCFTPSTPEYCTFTGGSTALSGTMPTRDVFGVTVTCGVSNGGQCNTDSDCSSGHCVYLGDLEATQVGWPGTTTGKMGTCYSADEANELIAQQRAAIVYAPLIYMALDENYFPSSVEYLLAQETIDCVDPSTGAETSVSGRNALDILSPSAKTWLPDPSTQASSVANPTPPAHFAHDDACRLNLVTPLHGGVDCNPVFNQQPGWPDGTGLMAQLQKTDCQTTAGQNVLYPLFKGQGGNLTSSVADLNSPDPSVVPIYAIIYGYGPGFFNVEYKTFYPYNYGKQACAGLWNGGCQGNWTIDDNHVADWEGMSIQFVNYQPAAVRTGAHSTSSIGRTFLADVNGVYPNGGPPAASYLYPSPFVMSGGRQDGTAVLQGVDSVPWANLSFFSGHPMVYSASGSHGVWGDLGDANGLHMYQVLPTGEPMYDHTTQGPGWETWRHLVVVQQQGKAVPWYANYKGRWGEDPVTAGPPPNNGCTDPVPFTDGRQDCPQCVGYDCSACQVGGLQNICGNVGELAINLCEGSDTEYQLNSGPTTPNATRDVPTLPSRIVSLVGNGSTAIQVPTSAFQPCSGASEPTCPSAVTAGTVNPIVGSVPILSETWNRAATFRIVPGLDPSVIDGVSIEAFTLETDNGGLGGAAWFNSGTPGPGPKYRYYLTWNGWNGSNGTGVDVEALDTGSGTPKAFLAAATFKMHQNPASPNGPAAFESYGADVAFTNTCPSAGDAGTGAPIDGGPPPAPPAWYLTGGSTGLSVVASTSDPVASNETSLLFSTALPFSSAQPGSYYHVQSEAPILTWNNSDSAASGCAALHVTNNTGYWAWITVYAEADPATAIRDHLAVPPGVEWTLTDGACGGTGVTGGAAGYDWIGPYKVRAQVFATEQDLAHDQNQVADTSICIAPAQAEPLIYVLLAAVYLVDPVLAYDAIAAVFAYLANVAVVCSNPDAAKIMASFALDALDSNGAATQSILGLFSKTLGTNLNNDNTSVGLWLGDQGNFYWSDPGFSPSDGGGNGSCAF